MRTELEVLKNCRISDMVLTIRSALSSADEVAFDAFVDAVAKA